MRHRHLLFAAVAASCLQGGHALAQSDDGADSVAPLVVQALPFGRSQSDIATPVVKLGGEELVFQRRATLGDTLSSQPGINSDTFGGGASRPVIRGQTAPRIKILSDSSEVVDASQVSPDHAVVAEPLLIEEIEVLRGPSALLYGGGAIGGAVNLIDGKIPTRIPTDGIAGVAEFRGGTNADERAGVAGLTVGAGRLAFHAEGVIRRSDDYEDGHGARVPGSYNDSDTGSVGLSYVAPDGYLGAAYTRQKSKYGLPGHNHEFESCHPHGVTLHCGGHDDHEGEDHDHGHDEAGEAPPWVDLKSDRFDLRGEYRTPMAGIERVRLRAGYTTYRHDEVDGGEIATTFKNQGWDSRLEVEHTKLAGWRGVFGAQLVRTDSSALGEDAFLPPASLHTSGLFLLEEMTTGPLRLEIAARQEWQTIDPLSAAPRRKHAPFSVSGGAVWTVTPGYSLAVSLARSQRAPTTQELFARGVHLATNTYEIGDPGLRKETSNSADLTFRKTDGATTFTVSGFVNRIDDYIYADTLDQLEEFRLIRYAQADAQFVGFDAELRRKFSDTFSLAVVGDYVKGRLTRGAGDLPRIPAARLGAHADFTLGGFTADLEYFHVFRQGRVAGFETPTPGYEMLNMTLAYDVPLAGAAGQIYLRGANLFDELALNHTSFVKNAAPLAGRTLTVGVRARF